MPDWLPALIAGIVLLMIAAGTAWHQWRGWQRGPAALPADDESRIHAARQLRRRLQISAMLGLIGLLIPLGDVLPIFRRSPTLFVVFWLGVLGVVIWIVLLALGDLASNVAQTKLAQSHLHAERKALEQEIRRYRTQNNGHQSE